MVVGVTDLVGVGVTVGYGEQTLLTQVPTYIVCIPVGKFVNDFAQKLLVVVFGGIINVIVALLQLI